MSITGGVHFDLVKRVLRDINRSGQAPEEIIQQVCGLLAFNCHNCRDMFNTLSYLTLSFTFFCRFLFLYYLFFMLSGGLNTAAHVGFGFVLVQHVFKSHV